MSLAAQATARRVQIGLRIHDPTPMGWPTIV